MSYEALYVLIGKRRGFQPQTVNSKLQTTNFELLTFNH